MSMRRKLTEKLQERTALLEKAEGLLKEGKREDYRAEMEKVRNMNADTRAAGRGCSRTPQMRRSC